MNEPTYVVTAYRWGCLQNHHYIVYAGTDKAKACAMAEDERDSRGNKYGVLVQACFKDPAENPAWEYTTRYVAYYPSNNEPCPYIDYESEAHKHVGGLVVSAVKTGTVLVPDEESRKTVNGMSSYKLMNLEVDAETCLPAWLRNRVAEERRLQEFNEGVQQRLVERRLQEMTDARDNVDA